MGGGRRGGGKRDYKGGGKWEKKGKLCNIAQYFVIKKMQTGGSQQEVGGLNPPDPPVPLPMIG